MIRPLWALISLVLLVTAAAANIYLGYLYLQVQRSGAETVDSFCNLGEGLNCVVVAASSYATFLGLPVALYGAEYFLGCAVLLVYLLSRPALRPIWQSFIFWSMLIALPASVVMAYVAAFRIGELCPLCTLVYVINVFLLLVPILSNRHALKALVTGAPVYIFSTWRHSSLRITTILIAALIAVQLLWLPPHLSPSLSASPRQPSLAHGGDHLGILTKARAKVGPDAAPIRVLEFSDFECGACAQGHRIMVDILNRYPGKIRFEHRDYPLDQACNRALERPLHRQACRAAAAAICANKQGKFWPLISQLFANQRTLGPAQFMSAAKAARVDSAKLKKCMNQPETRQKILNDVEEGIRRNIRGTPTFFLNGKEVLGPKNIAFWTEKIESILKAKTLPPATKTSPPRKR